MTRIWAGLAIATGLLLAACQPAQKGVDERRLNAADSDSGEWMTTGRTYSEQRYSPLTKVSTDTVGQLDRKSVV